MPERGGCSVSTDTVIKCGIDDSSGHMQDFGSLSPGKGIVNVQEPQLSVSEK